MRRTRKTATWMSATFLAVGMAALLAGCGGDDPAAPTGDELTPAEAAAITEYMTGKAFSGWVEEAGAENAVLGEGSGEPVQIDYDVQVTGPCDEGGTVTVSVELAGTVDDATQSGTLSLDLTTSADACAFPAEGTVFTLDTDPDLRLVGDLQWEAGLPVGENTFTYDGTVLWGAEDGRSGSCVFDLQVTYLEDGTTLESGTACGMSLSS